MRIYKNIETYGNGTYGDVEFGIRPEETGTVSDRQESKISRANAFFWAQLELDYIFKFKIINVHQGI